MDMDWRGGATKPVDGMERGDISMVNCDMANIASC